MKFARMCATLALAIAASTAMGATFSANNGGAIGTSSTIGTVGGEDYSSLLAAATDFSTFAGSVAANYTFFITSNLDEPTNLSWIKDTNGFSITVKPAISVTPTITFQQTADNAGTSGHWLIGTNTLVVEAQTPTKNFIIDGSNTDGGTTRDLTITNVASASTNSVLVQLRGDHDNYQIKNCIITQNSTFATTSGVSAIIRTAIGSTTVQSPDNGLIKNNIITVAAPGSNSDKRGINLSSSGTVPAGNSIQNTTIEGNLVTARQRPIFMNLVGSTTIRNNTIRVVATNAAGFLGTAINHNLANSGGWTMNITGNVVDQLATVDTSTNGIRGIQLTPSDSSTTTNNGTYNVWNNVVTGFSFTATAASTATTANIGGIVVGGSIPTMNINVWNNSVNIASNNVYTAISTGNYFRHHGIGVFGGGVHAVNVRNNVVRVDTTRGSAYAYVSSFPTAAWQAGTPNFNVGFNAASGGAMIQTGATFYTSFSAFTTTFAGRETDAVTKDPLAAGTAPYNGTWTSASDLHWNGDPGIAAGTPIGAVTVDIDGQTRNTVQPYRGADEILTSLVIDNSAVNPVAGTTGLGSSTNGNLTVTNTGLRVASISAAALTGGTDFNSTSNTFPILAANGDGAKNVVITFAPTSLPVGAKNDTVTLTVNGETLAGQAVSGTSTPPASIADWTLLN